jgi:hypothetical protein
VTAISVSLGTFLVILLGIVGGVFLRTKLPPRYFDESTIGTVKLSAGVIATLTALTLGLLIASAKNSYDAQIGQIRQIAAGVILTDRLLTLYGGDAAHNAKAKLRDMVAPVTDQIWRENGAGGKKEFHAADESEDYVKSLYALNPQTEIQRGLRERILQTTLEIAHARLALFSQMNNLLPPPLLVVLAFWFAMLFAAYSMHAEINAVSVGALTICAASIAGAMFLLFQMSNPFSGVMAIPRVDLLSILPPL